MTATTRFGALILIDPASTPNKIGICQDNTFIFPYVQCCERGFVQGKGGTKDYQDYVCNCRKVLITIHKPYRTNSARIPAVGGEWKGANEWIRVWTGLEDVKVEVSW